MAFCALILRVDGPKKNRTDKKSGKAIEKQNKHCISQEEVILVSKTF